MKALLTLASLAFSTAPCCGRLPGVAENVFQRLAEAQDELLRKASLSREMRAMGHEALKAPAV